MDDAHEILSVFGIDPSSRGYQRWRRADRFRQVDFEGLLHESRVVLTVDWRQSLQDAVDVIIRQVNELGIEASAGLSEDGEQGVLQAAGLLARIKYVPAHGDDFDRVIAAVNRMIGGFGAPG